MNTDIIIRTFTARLALLNQFKAKEIICAWQTISFYAENIFCLATSAIEYTR